jgi:energy-coupling factor transporter ATP-binding protein EcfA2
MATIRRVTFHRLRNVKPGCTLELHPGLNVLLGQNGTGKTTLLQWMADFLSGDLLAWDEEPYHVEFEMEIETQPEHTYLRVRVENESFESMVRPGALSAWADLQGFPTLPTHADLFTVNITLEAGEARYEIHDKPSQLSFQANDIPLIMSDIPQHATRASRVSRLLGPILDTASLLQRSTFADTVHEAARQRAMLLTMSILRILHSSYTHNTDRFDESLVFFHRIVEGREAQAYVALDRTHPQGKAMRFVPDEIGALVASKTQERESNLQTLTFTSEEAKGVLASAVRLFQHCSASIHLSLLEKDVRGAQAVTTYGNLRFTFERHDGSIFSHDKLSYGQKRMLSFLYYLALNPRLIIVDELVNGLHHAWIEACIEEIGDRQGILTSQNPLLLDYLTFESADDVRRRFILCRSERDSETGRDQLIWRNPTLEEAESFYSAYQAGIQHVGEILVDKGFW